MSLISYNITDNFNKIIKELISDGELTELDHKVIRYLKYINENKNKYPLPTKLKIITRSTAARFYYKDESLFTEIERVATLLYNDITKEKRNKIIENVIGMQYKEFEYNYLKKKKKVKKNQFYNCFSVKIKATPNSTVNMKFFNNGSITMTGCIEDDSATNALKTMIKYLKHHSAKFENPDKIDTINYKDLRTTMINNNFCLNFNVNRNKLYTLLKDNYDLFISYEPEKYQAVKVSYMFNKSNKYTDGICYCNNKCKGKGWGLEDGDCKRVTIAIFQSGNIGINGSRTIEQIREVYQFINTIMKTHYNDVIRFSILDIDKYKDAPKKIKLKIKKV
tara:strand:- start:292 stop:1296 length:1005 start_codon:yes stop_codon:yes gene_type:complete